MRDIDVPVHVHGHVAAQACVCVYINIRLTHVMWCHKRYLNPACVLCPRSNDRRNAILPQPGNFVSALHGGFRFRRNRFVA